MAIYGNTLDSLQGAKLADAEAKVRANAAYRDYLLGLASERNRGRQIDVNSKDADTRRQDVGSRNQLGNRQIDLGGREVDMRGEDIRSRERIAGQDANVRRAALEIDRAYKDGLIKKMERDSELAKLGITTTAGLEEKRIGLTRDEIGKKYDYLGRGLDLNETVESNRLENARTDAGIRLVDAATRAQDANNRRDLGLATVGVSKQDAETRALAVKNQYDIAIRNATRQGLKDEADLLLAQRDYDLRKIQVEGELKQRAIGNAMTYDINNRGMILNEKSNPARIGVLESQARSVGIPSEAYRLERSRDAVATAGRRNRAAMLVQEANKRYTNERSGYMNLGGLLSWNHPINQHVMDVAKELGDPSLLDYVQIDPAEDGKALLVDQPNQLDLPDNPAPRVIPGVIPGVIDSNAPPGRVMYRVGPNGRLVQ